MPPADRPAWFEGLHLARVLAAPDTSAHLERARNLLDTHFDTAVTLDDAARTARYSPHHFHRLFAAAYGATPHEYLTQRRLDEARRLLETTDLTVTDVCMAVGFSSLGSFSSLFARHVGRPPSAYRRRIFAMRWGGGRGPAAVPACFLRRFAPA